MLELQRVYNLDKLVGDLRKLGFSVIYIKTSKYNSVFDLTPVPKPDLTEAIDASEISRAIQQVASVLSFDPTSRKVVIQTNDAQSLLNRLKLAGAIDHVEILRLPLDESLEALSKKINYPIAHFSPISNSKIKNTVVSCDVEGGDIVSILSEMMSYGQLPGGWTLSLSVDQSENSPFALIYTY